MTSYFILNGKLYNPNSIDNVPRIQVGDPLCVTFKSITIVSNKFDRFGKSEIIVANNVKNVASKDRVLQSVTYYDNDAKITKARFGTRVGKYKITNFDASQYGYPVAFYIAGYQGTALTITTKMLEVDDYSSVSKLMKVLSLGMSTVGQLTSSPLVPLVNEAMGLCSILIQDIDAYKELCEEHTLALSQGMPVGLYLCIPELTDINLRKQIMNDYIVEDLGLYTVSEIQGDRTKRDQVVNSAYTEYPGTYFILEVSTDSHPELCDFDFTASTADIISKITSKAIDTKALTDQVVTMSRQAYDMGLIQVITLAYQKYQASGSASDKAQLTALYNQLASGPLLPWFITHFPDISKVVTD